MAETKELERDLLEASLLKEVMLIDFIDTPIVDDININGRNYLILK